MKKYKSCCGLRCLLEKCEVRDNGGCYCVCILKDYEHSLERVLDRSIGLIPGGGFIYKPEKAYPPLHSFERIEIKKKLKNIRKKIKTYELEDEIIPPKTE